MDYLPRLNRDIILKRMRVFGRKIMLGRKQHVSFERVIKSLYCSVNDRDSVCFRRKLCLALRTMKIITFSKCCGTKRAKKLKTLQHLMAKDNTIQIRTSWKGSQKFPAISHKIGICSLIFFHTPDWNCQHRIVLSPFLIMNSY